MRPTVYIGLMSGTSLDGVDAVACTFEPQTQCLGHTYVAFDDALRQSLQSLLTAGFDEIERSGRVAIELVHVYARAVADLLKKTQISANDVVAIGVHGQTIRHCPNDGFTVQLNNPALLAELTGIDVIADFRSRDMAAGGEGAPLVPAFHAALFGNETENRTIVNIGGIANITLLPSDTSKPTLGFDCGPGNTLLDIWMQAHQGARFDENGAWAQTGSINDALLTSFLSDEYFERPAPKSSGREYFNMDWIRCELFTYPKINPADVQRTLVRLTAQTIVDATYKAQPDTRAFFICGGGVFNPVLMADLRELAAPATVESTAQLGVDPMQVEAMAFAWLAYRFVNKKAGNLPAVTNAKGPRILGALYPAY
ncbi:MAG: anhydro-N-acetylmuramic acid kinase [Burkholderiaceae bacterium]|nr:anhydro-N-acetylmuramic acid kinase [Burkholderiaceae bacterium]